MRLLLLEDDQADASRVRRELFGRLPDPAVVCVFTSLKDAIDQLESAEFDVVLTDLNLPDSHGVETVKQLVDVAGDAIVIVLTGSNDEELGAAAISCGAHDYVCKDYLGENHLARTIRYAVERNTLIQERQEAREDLLVATTQEQLRIGRELHDGICQLQTVALTKAEELLASLSPANGRAVAQTTELVEILNKIRTEVRAAVQDLMPPELAKHGLPSALSKLTRQWHNTNGIRCLCDVPTAIQLPSQHVALQLYRISQEALHNAVRHSQADRISLALLGTERAIKLQVQDNGCGFNATRLLNSQKQLGIRSMGQRATAIGGKLTIQSQPGRGTAVICVVPISTRRAKARPQQLSA